MALKPKRVKKPKLTPEELKTVEENIAELEQKVIEKMSLERQKRLGFKESIRLLRASTEEEIYAKRVVIAHTAADQRTEFERTCRKDREELRVIKAELAALKRRLKSHYHYPRKQQVIDNHLYGVHIG